MIAIKRPDQNPGLGLDILESIGEEIKEHFFINQLRIIEQDRMTATEIIQRRDEQFRSFGSILSRIFFEGLQPQLNRLFGMIGADEETG